MKRAIESFIGTYGKYMAAAAYASKECNKYDIEYMISLFRNDSHK